MRAPVLMTAFLMTAAPSALWAIGDSSYSSSPLSSMMPSVQTDLYTLSGRVTSDPQITPDDVAKLNRDLVEALRLEPLPQSRRLPGVSPFEASEILQRMMSHPVVGAQATQIYDPSGRFGFCFGRAQWTVIELLRRGVDKASIKKIFAVGPMKDDGINWQFHVATMVRGKEGGWYIIDSVYKTVMTVEAWMADLSKSSVDKKLMFHVTDPMRLGASTTEKFSGRHFRSPFNDPEYNKYFEDMMKDFKELSRQKVLGRRSCEKALL